MTVETGWAIFASVAVAHALGVASPGPDFAIVIRQSLARGRSAGVWTAAGIGSGILFHVGYGLFGLRWLTQRYPWSLDAIAVAGAAFLIWMGVGALRAPAQAPSPEDTATIDPRRRRGNWKRDYAIGLATNLLNPKATLFFVALFSSVVAGPVSAPMMVVLGAWLPLSTFAWFSGLALLLSHEGVRNALRRHAQRIDRAMGMILIVLGALVLLATLRGA